MKLVDILARELKVWPNDEYESIGQSCTGTLHKSPNWLLECGWTKEAYTMADDWSRVHVTRAQWQAAVDALKAEVSPTESMALHHQEFGRITRQWNGEGLPPVGTNAENREYGGVTVLAHGVFRGQTMIICQGDDTIVTCTPDQLTQIRTPEQIAAEERSIAVSEIISAIGWIHGTPGATEAAGRLYDAGYRKQKDS